MIHKNKYHIFAALLAVTIISSMVVFPFLTIIFNNTPQLQESASIKTSSSISQSLSSSSVSIIVSSSSEISSVLSSSRLTEVSSKSTEQIESKPEIKIYDEVKTVFTQPIAPQIIQTQSEIQPDIQPKAETMIAAPKTIIQTPAVQPAPAITPPPVLTSPRANEFTNAGCNIGLANQMLILINAHRATNGVGPLSLASDLNGVACAHSKWMTATGTFSHTGRDGTNPFERCTKAGTACYAENIAYNTETSALNLFTQLKESPGHNANMLDGGFVEVGLGFDSVYVTQLFR
jgi:uncharacterized protein YkwD